MKGIALWMNTEKHQKQKIYFRISITLNEKTDHMIKVS